MEFDANDSSYNTISLLGQCWNGLAIVHLSKHLPSRKLVIVKRFNMDLAKEEATLVSHEIILTKQLQHPNIISYLASYVVGPEVCVVSSLMAFGSCRDLLNIHFSDGLPENAILLILRQVLQGLDYIHRKGFIHRALKASHILVSDEGDVKLTGLRYACPIIEHGRWQKQIHSFPSSTAKNLNWLSPEVLEQNLKGYNEKSDMYSLGLVLCELANGTEPFAGMPTTLMLIEKVKGAAPVLLDCTTAPRDENNEIHGLSQNQTNRRFSEGLHQITALCLQKEPIYRPSPTQLLTHSYLKFNKKSLPLPELLKPALPLSDRVAQDTDDLANLDTIQRMSQLEIHTCEWDF